MVHLRSSSCITSDYCSAAFSLVAHYHDLNHSSTRAIWQACLFNSCRRAFLHLLCALHGTPPPCVPLGTRRFQLGFVLCRRLYPHVRPSIRFLSVRPEVCPWVSRFPTSGFLQIPSHDGHPCLRLYPSHYRADLGLSPVRNVRRQAHTTKSP